MKEITRIHLAKVAYDIEIDAKTDIQEYISALERYADDPELLGDIEIRITELLAERGVTAGGVIAKDDVAAVRAQLGEPSDFASEDTKVSGAALEDEPRRVYRDESEAIVGGVLAGFAKFFGIDALWVRLIFIVLLLASFGTAVIVYLILWLIVPPARTAADKLRMAGHPVTLASIKALGERAEPATSEAAQTMRSLLRTGSGVVLVLGALGAIATVVTVAGAPVWIDNSFAGRSVMDTWWIMTGFGLCALAGLLLAALCLVLASSVFRRRWSRRVSVAVATIVIAGFLSFLGGIGTLWYGAWQDGVQVSALMQTTRKDLPSGFASIKALEITSDNSIHNFIRVEYNVSDKLYWELEALPGVEPKLELSNDGVSASIQVTQARNTQLHTWGGWEYLAQPVLRVYGPALDSIEVRDIPKTSYRNEQSQNTLNVVLKGSSFELTGSSYEEVMVAIGESSEANLSGATIRSVIANNNSKGGSVEAGVVRNLAVTQPDICPVTLDASAPSMIVRVQAVSGGKLTYNGKEEPAKSISNSCGKVVVGNGDDLSDEL